MIKMRGFDDHDNHDDDWKEEENFFFKGVNYSLSESIAVRKPFSPLKLWAVKSHTPTVDWFQQDQVTTFRLWGRRSTDWAIYLKQQQQQQQRNVNAKTEKKKYWNRTKAYITISWTNSTWIIHKL